MNQSYQDRLLFSGVKYKSLEIDKEKKEEIHDKCSKRKGKYLYLVFKNFNNYIHLFISNASFLFYKICLSIKKTICIMVSDKVFILIILKDKISNITFNLELSNSDLKENKIILEDLNSCNSLLKAKENIKNCLKISTNLKKRSVA